MTIDTISTSFAQLPVLVAEDIVALGGTISTGALDLSDQPGIPLSKLSGLIDAAFHEGRTIDQIVVARGVPQRWALELGESN